MEVPEETNTKATTPKKKKRRTKAEQETDTTVVTLDSSTEEAGTRDNHKAVAGNHAGKKVGAKAVIKPKEEEQTSSFEAKEAVMAILDKSSFPKGSISFTGPLSKDATEVTKQKGIEVTKQKSIEVTRQRSSANNTSSAASSTTTNGLDGVDIVPKKK